MKKSKAITLVLVTGLLGCKHQPTDRNRLYMRTDSAGSYSSATTGFHGYYVFRAYGTYYDGGYYGNGYGGRRSAFGGRAGYIRQGYAHSGFHTAKSSGVSRGGFGRSGGFHASSSS
ncbi:hypothetical protein Mucpa_0396 [Mucilaginibacter paludis DSM 18603]|uniref:Lipoprotein n=2 Tax=Mucilaginibacter TaxID=423349 RepID=H1YH89_9SPHI|nr:hypothetical protein Mucpa_0396 [Mucilaginibacter paludis DSM 18603]